MIFSFDKLIIFRFFIILILISIAVGLFLASRAHTPNLVEQSKQDIQAMIQSFDRDIDSVLVQFKIEKNWCRKKEILTQEEKLSRIERRVLIPPDIIPIQLNRAINLVAQRYGGRAIGSEILRENTVTIHIKLDKVIIETIVLKLAKDLKR